MEKENGEGGMQKEGWRRRDAEGGMEKEGWRRRDGEGGMEKDRTERGGMERKNPSAAMNGRVWDVK